MSVETSFSGRVQFSLEKANRVRYRSPSVAAAVTTRRAALTPSRCPAIRGSPRRVAQRPFPSMITATCSGSGCARMAARSLAAWGSGVGAAPRDRSEAMDAPIGLDAQDFPFLLLQELVNPGDEAIGRLLDLFVPAALLVLRRLAISGQLLELVVGVAATLANGHPPLFRHLAHGLGELLAALLGQRRNHQANHLAVVHGGDPEIGGHQGFLDGLELPRLPGLDADGPGVGYGDRGHLVERREGPVVVDAEAIEEARRSPSGPDGRELPTQRLRGRGHVGLHLFHQLLHLTLPSRTMLSLPPRTRMSPCRRGHACHVSRPPRTRWSRPAHPARSA